ncbi:7-carboxy-7-deazaguanine synthase QueE [Phycicoccus flavus]|uniref:7-carboxy-7-deazaguanine synthase QueE n=1 Tax=Phycicoccus flavus TaxID=2502783 RepID=UPI000FEC137F|nr:7-carboxy-7-deazaguanine synthase QueE [Phycicoccus flavus]NHA67469.1 7-carboxy-7-deazaguanine synthase QueE [Phycicoccus flavus]
MTASDVESVDQLLISEVFGPTLQGEGPSAGQTASFVRLGGCNLACSWCDTPYSWDASRYDLDRELRYSPVEDVVDRVLDMRTALTVISGGEPALQRAALLSLAQTLRGRERRVEIETNGTVPLGPLGNELDLVVVSPKLRNSGIPLRNRRRPEVLRELAALKHSVFKFVVTSRGDLAEVETAQRDLALRPSQVWVMPEGTDTELLTARLRELAGPVADRGWSLSHRLQIVLWGGARGR